VPEQTVPVKRKVKAPIAPLAPAIRALREHLGETQSGMARRLGLKSERGYRYWEDGGRTPRGKRLAQLVEMGLSDVLGKIEEARSLMSGREDAVLARNETVVNISLHPTAVRYANDATIGIQIIYEAAVAGNEGAVEVLRDCAERINEKAARWHDSVHRKSNDLSDAAKTEQPRLRVSEHELATDAQERLHLRQQASTKVQVTLDHRAIAPKGRRR